LRGDLPMVWIREIERVEVLMSVEIRFIVSWVAIALMLFQLVVEVGNLHLTLLRNSLSLIISKFIHAYDSFVVCFILKFLWILNVLRTHDALYLVVGWTFFIHVAVTYTLLLLLGWKFIDRWRICQTICVHRAIRHLHRLDWHPKSWNVFEWGSTHPWKFRNLPDCKLINSILLELLRA
jgi:hypothetical protein